jgi:hypothetical protein
VTIFSRPEAVDEVTGTASPLTITATRYAANVLEVVELPQVVYHAGTSMRHVSEIWKALPPQWLPPFLLLESRIYSFHDLDSPANPLGTIVDGGDTESLSIKEFSAGEDGARHFVRLLNLCLQKHFYRRGLVVDMKRKRAYFPRSDGGARAVTYQARLRRATRTVVKARTSPRTGKVSYWEHEALGFRFEQFGDMWGLLLEPGYVFTFDGRKGLLAPDRVNKLSTKRAARDYNSAVLNDLSFWTWLLSGGDDGSFRLEFGPPPPLPSDGPESIDTTEDNNRPATIPRRSSTPPIDTEDVPVIALASRLPTVVVNDAALAAGEPDDGEDEEETLELEEELAKLAEEQREAEAQVDVPQP